MQIVNKQNKTVKDYAGWDIKELKKEQVRLEAELRTFQEDREILVKAIEIEKRYNKEE